jgi:hypothetical protein
MKKISVFTGILCFCIMACIKDKRHSENAGDTISTAAASRDPKPAAAPAIQWQKCIGTAVNEYGYGVTKALDGSGYFLTGTTETSNRGRDVMVAKIDITGSNIVWQYNFGGSGNDEGMSIVALPGGGCIVAAKTTSNDGDVQGFKGGNDIWLLQLSVSGALGQSKTFGGSGFEIPGQIIATTDGGYMVAGETTSNDGDLVGSGTTKGRGWILKLDGAINLQWQKTLDVPGSKDDIAYGITESSGGTFALTGRSLSVDNNADIWAASFDRDNIYWNRSFGSTGGDVGFEIVASQNNGTYEGFVIAGYIGGDASATKLNTDGSTAWQKTFRPGSSLARAHSIVSTANEYIITGDNTGDMLVWRLTKDGTQLNGTTIGGGKNDNSYHTIATDDGKYISVGSTSSTNGIVSGNHGMSDMWLVKFSF